MHNEEYLPDEIRIGSKRYKVVARNAEWYEQTGSYGSMDADHQTVNVTVENRSLGDILDTLLHETLHAVWEEWNIPSRPREERAVRGLGTGLAAVYAQNPEYVQSIAKLVKDINDE